MQLTRRPESKLAEQPRRLHNPVTVASTAAATAAGVVVSFFEWVQNLQNFQWDDEEVSRKLDR